MSPRRTPLCVGLVLLVLLVRSGVVWADPNAIWVMNSDGSQPRLLVKIPGQRAHGSPAFSHDGKRLAFDCYPTGSRSRGNIYVADADGQNPVSLGLGARPDWSPDDKQLAFFVLENNGGPETPGIWVMNVDGQARTWLCGGHHPRWSPDGATICFCRQTEGARNANLYLYDMVEGGEKKVLETDWLSISAACWSPDGERLAFIGRRTEQSQAELCLVNSDGATESLATRHTGDLGFFPAWSPDGERLVFFLRVGNPRAEVLHWALADGNDPPVMFPEQAGIRQNWDAAFSPDGEQLAFPSSR